MSTQEVLDAVCKVMEEYDIRPGQKVDTLLQCLEAEADAAEADTDEDEEDEESDESENEDEGTDE